MQGLRSSSRLRILCMKGVSIILLLNSQLSLFIRIHFQLVTWKSYQHLSFHSSLILIHFYFFGRTHES